MVSYFKHTKLTAAQRQTLETEKKKLRQRAKMDEVRLSQLVAFNCKTYDAALGRVLMRCETMPLSKYVRAAKTEIVRKSKSTREIMRRVSCLTQAILAARIPACQARVDKYGWLHIQTMMELEGEKNPSWEQDLFLHNTSSPRASLTARSLDGGLYAEKGHLARNAFFYAVWPAYRKGKKLLNRIKGQGVTWKEDFLRFDAKARRVKYCLLRMTRAQNKIDQYGAVLTVARRYNLALGGFRWKMHPNSLEKPFRQSVLQSLFTPELFDAATQNWAPEQTLRAKKLVRGIAFADHRISQINQDLGIFVPR